LGKGPHFAASETTSESMMGSTATWPNLLESVRRVGTLSVLELERQIGIPVNMSLRRSGLSLSTIAEPSNALGDPPDISTTIPATTNDSFVNRLIEGVEMQSINRIPRPPSLLSLHEPLVYADNDQTRDQDTHINTSEVADEQDLPILSPPDIFLFERIFNLHPFAAAAFLRAFIACSFGLLLFHAHSLLTWPGSTL